MATNPWYRDEDDRRPVVVFGNLASSALARFVLEHDSPYRVAAFTVDAAYCNGDSHEGLPLLPFETLEREFGLVPELPAMTTLSRGSQPCTLLVF